MNQSTENHHKNKPAQPAISFPIIGIGASAGGLESLEAFFQALSDNPGAAFVVIQHLSPDFKSYMPELLRKKTSLAICTAEDEHRLVPNTIYLIPPSKNLAIQNQRLHLSDIQPDQVPNKPIDLFFHSLATSGEDDIVAVVLSGTGSDGALGVGEVYSAGGRVFIETAASAAFDGMPNAAIATRAYTGTGTPTEIAQRIFNPPEAAEDDAELTQKVSQSQLIFSRIFAAIEESYGVDFSEYKKNTIERRIDKRIFERDISDLSDYWELIQNNPSELQDLYYDLLIGVTEFFRDKEAFTVLREQIALKIKNKESGDTFRVWIPGCASGEEVYSIAILIDEECVKANKKIECKIFATDIDDHVLSTAAAGCYAHDKVANIPASMLAKYFSEEGSSHFKIINDIRSRIVFAKHNVVADAPFTKLDLISCRNMLIYLDTEAQKRVLSLFYFSLLTEGLMFLGPSESLGKYKTGYESIHNKWKLFLKTAQAPDYVTLNSNTRKSSFPAIVSAKGVAQSQAKAVNISMLNAEIERAHIALAESYLPPSLLIDEKLMIHHIYGELPDIVMVKSGKFSQNLRSLCHESLCSAVSIAVLEAKKQSKNIEYTNFKLVEHEAVKQINFKVAPLRIKAAMENARYYLLVVDDIESSPLAKADDFVTHDASELKQLALLEEELTVTRQALQSNIEELATANEELQSANEELMAANEELQSTNEELQSVNEELYSVNAEHQQKITELTELSVDEENLLKSTDIGTLFLDRFYRIRKFTPVAASLFNLLPQDIGRPFSHLTHHFTDVDFEEQLQQVSERTSRKIIEASDGRATYQIRFNAYINQHKQFDGVVISLIDTSALKQAQTSY